MMVENLISGIIMVSFAGLVGSLMVYAVDKMK
jgi:hypothetical protein